ncbi:MAG: response regulator [Gallionella sp.]
MIRNEEILNARILIVDDQQANVILLSELLRDVGYSCIESTMNPFAVCALHRKNHYDLILLDMQMPGMDGFEVMEELKQVEMDSYLPVLVITAQPDHKLRALVAGARDFVAKPFDLLEVQTRIRNMLEVRLLYQQLENYNKLLEQKVQARTAELSASEARFRRLTELSSDWYWEQDENGHFIKIFGPVLEMLGIQIGEALSESSEGWIESERQTLAANLAARTPFLDFTYSRIKADGTRQYLMVSGEPMFNASGLFTGYRGVGKDVTDTIQLVSAQKTADFAL